jgi:hypothetical protein
MCQELCGGRDWLIAKCDDCGVWLCFDPEPGAARVVRTPAVTGEDQLCVPCLRARQAAQALRTAAQALRRRLKAQ